jgi:hypothetical protein
MKTKRHLKTTGHGEVSAFYSAEDIDEILKEIKNEVADAREEFEFCEMHHEERIIGFHNALVGVLRKFGCIDDAYINGEWK